MRTRDAIAILLDYALDEGQVDGCDYPKCRRLARYNVEIHNHWGWVRCEDHAKAFNDGPVILYEMNHADAVAHLEKRMGLSQDSTGEDIMNALRRKPRTKR